jgi:hypothetical protein
MGLTGTEIEGLTYKEFLLRYIGYADRNDAQWNHTRHIMQYIRVFSGFGSGGVTPVSQIWPLRTDTDDTPRMITTEKQALELLRDFESALHD